MAFFGKSLQNPTIHIRKETVSIKSSSLNRPVPPSKSAVASKVSRRAISRTDPVARPTTTRTNKEDHKSLQPRKRRRTNLTPSNSSTPFDNDSSDDDDIDTKRSRSTSAIPKSTNGDDSIDFNRRLRARNNPSEEDGGTFSIIHAADVASLGQDKFEPALKASREDNLKVKLYYPGASQPERYQLVTQKDKLNSIQEILNIVENVSFVYLTPEQVEEFTDDNTGIIRKLQRATNLNSIQDFKSAVQLYNTKIKQYQKDGAFAKNLDLRHNLPRSFVELVLSQIYDRTVSPEVDSLRAYKNGTDNVYGELKSPFISRIFSETGLKSNQTFLDLGSGCGNVVLQAALQVGCESWGCEMMPNACTLAAKQEKEFAARCRLWGIAPGQVHLEQGDFLENEPTKKILKKADVILVNNQAFTPKLNDVLRMLFLDLKYGCRVVSLKPFVRSDQIGSRNENDLGNIFSESKKGHFYANDVSWTDNGIGDFYIATRG